MAIDVRLRDGIAAARARRIDEARALLQQCVDAAPDNSAAWFWLAMVSPSGKTAASHLRRVLALDPAHAAAREALAKLLFAQAERMRHHATRLFRDAAVVSPEDPRIWRAVIQLANTPAEALNAVRELHALAPAFGEATHYLRDALVADARAHDTAGDRAGARDRWREAVGLDDRDIEAWIGVAESADDGDERREALAKAAALDSLHSGVVAMQERLAREEYTAARHRDGAEETPVATTPMASASEAAAMSGTAQSDDAANPHPTSSPALRTVLVVDDSPTIRKILSLTLEREGYTVWAEVDGESALRRLATLVPDLVLLDIAMPGIDGYETCKRIRCDARTAQLPVLMLSGKDALFDKVKGHMAGATEYLTKPFAAATVVAAVAGALADAA